MLQTRPLGGFFTSDCYPFIATSCHDPLALTLPKAGQYGLLGAIFIILWDLLRSDTGSSVKYSGGRRISGVDGVIAYAVVHILTHSCSPYRVPRWSLYSQYHADPRLVGSFRAFRFGNGDMAGHVVTHTS